MTVTPDPSERLSWREVAVLVAGCLLVTLAACLVVLAVSQAAAG